MVIEAPIWLGRAVFVSSERWAVLGRQRANLPTPEIPAPPDR